MSAGSKSASTPFRGEFWSTDPKSRSITHFLFRQRKKGPTVEAWGYCTPTDCEWGEVPLQLLDTLNEKSAVHRAFATWQLEETITHILFAFKKGVLTSEEIRIGRNFPYFLRETFTKNPARARAARKAGPLDRIAHIWDGSHPGWKLCRYQEPVYLTELVFTEKGPSAKTRALLKKYLRKPPFKSRAKRRKYWSGMTGYYLDPHSQKTFQDLLRRKASGDFKLRTLKIKIGDYLILAPDDTPTFWNYSSRYRPIIVQKMRAAKVPIVQKTISD
jgi:hypothetical protein